MAADAAAPRPAPKRQRLKVTQEELVDTPLSIYRRWTNIRSPNEAQRALLSEITELDLWMETCKHWALSGWNARNIPNMLENYRRRCEAREQRRAVTHPPPSAVPSYDYDSAPDPYQEFAARQRARAK